MREVDRQFLELFDNADADGRKLIMDLLICASTCGKPFFEAMEKCLESGSGEAMLQELNKWIATTQKAGATV